MCMSMFARLFISFLFFISSVSSLKYANSISYRKTSTHSSTFLLPLLSRDASGTSLYSNVVYLTNISPLANNVACTALGASAALVWLQVWITLAKDGKIDPTLSRKIIHTGSAPLYMALFPLFSDDIYAKFFAASVPLSQLIRLLVAYTKSNGANEGLVTAISRTGDKKEALGGPFYYNVILFLVTLFAFRTSIPGIFVISQLAAGDGMADIIGRKYGKVKWPFSSKKSIAGSLGFVIGAFVVTCALLALYSATGCIAIDVKEEYPAVLLISILCAAAELLPVIDDNITVSVVAFLLSAYWFGL